MIRPEYRAQVDLLLRLLPHIAMEDSLALKGGTAINLFVREMPRLSVDIDLTFLQFNARPEALQAISDALDRIKARLVQSIPNTVVTKQAQSGGDEARLVCSLENATVKVEVNTVIRGCLWPTRQLPIVDAAQNEFGKFASIQVVSDAELYGGKICAALDRQHPRDLFDIHYLFTNEGITEDIKLGFVASLLSHPRPIHEMIRPRFQDQRAVFEGQFSGMAVEPFTYGDFEVARERLVDEIHHRLSVTDRRFLLSFKSGSPDWSLFPLATIKDLPAVQWKLANVQKLRAQNPRKHTELLGALEAALSR